MTDEQIEQLALKLYPELSSQYESYRKNNLYIQLQRESFIKGAKKLRDHYEQKLALIELTRTGE